MHSVHCTWNMHAFDAHSKCTSGYFCFRFSFYLSLWGYIFLNLLRALQYSLKSTYVCKKKSLWLWQVCATLLLCHVVATVVTTVKRISLKSNSCNDCTVHADPSSPKIGEHPVGTRQKFVRDSSGSRSKPYPFIYHSHGQKTVPHQYVFHRKLCPIYIL